MRDPTLELRGLDLNLLLALHVLLEEENVSRAAQRLGRTQSATSRMLGRLRTALNDPLLVRTGRGMRATPRAEAVRPALQAALAALVEVRRLGGSFDPIAARRQFVLAGPDALAPVGAQVMRVFAHSAPQCTLALRAAPPHPAPALLTGGVDVVLGPARSVGAELHRRTLGAVRWVSVHRADHPMARGPWTLARWCTGRHVVVTTGNATRSLVDVRLESLGHQRVVAVTTDGLLAALHLVAETDLLLTAPDVLARPVAARLGLQTRPMPLKLPHTETVAWGAPRMHADPAHQWFRRVVADAATHTLAESGPVL